MEPFNLCIIKPNKEVFSETFIQAHIDRLPGNKKVLYGGSFPVYDDEGNYLIKSKIALLSYLIQKRLFKKQDIAVRNNALVAYLKQHKIDIVLAEYGMVGAMVTKACRLANVPLVIHYHGADVHHHDTVNKYLPWYKKSFVYASKLVAVSNDMVDALKAIGAPADKLVLNPYGVDLSKFTIAPVSQSGINFLAVGRFVEKKSPSSVVKAFKIVVDKFPDAHLTMVGSGTLLEPTKHLADELGLKEKISFPGVQSSQQIQQLMQQSRCFVQHSVTAADGDMEGTPNTILEAGASGLAIVSTQHAGIKEAVINGETGYLVPEHDIEEMANYMLKIAADVQLAATIGSKEAEHIRKNYNITDRINTLAQILQQAINNN
ncbi:MAG: glycosyltransferase [Sphingobacteriaceae bacterium]|nr:MAG: glycosyltransferase [Sphingobacteriaceae bacterium]